MQPESKSVSIVGCGWLGTALARHMLSQNWLVRGSARTQEHLSALREVGIAASYCDVSPDHLEAEDRTLLQSNALVISIPPGRRSGHCEGFPQRIERLLERTNLEGRALVFLSSTSVYGTPAGIVREDSPLRPETASGHALVAAEAVVRRIAPHGVVCRLGGLIGPGRHPGRFLAGKQNVKQASSAVNLVHQRDCVEILAQLLAKPPSGETFNVVADAHPTRQEYYVQAATRLGLAPPTFAPSDDHPGKIVNNEKIRRLLDYTFYFPNPTVCLADSDSHGVSTVAATAF